MRNLLGSNVIFVTLDEQEIFMKVQGENEIEYTGFNEERFNVSVRKADIHHYRLKGGFNYVELSKMG